MVLKTYFWLCAQRSFLRGLLGESYKVLVIKPRIAACKASALPTVWPTLSVFKPIGSACEPEKCTKMLCYLCN